MCGLPLHTAYVVVFATANMLSLPYPPIPSIHTRSSPTVPRSSASHTTAITSAATAPPVPVVATTTIINYRHQL